MTQEELRDKIDAIQNTKVVDFSKYNSVEAWQEEKLIELINQHVKVVIGEDLDAEELKNDMTLYYNTIQNNRLKAEQRKRAGLE